MSHGTYILYVLILWHTPSSLRTSCNVFLRFCCHYHSTEISALKVSRNLSLKYPVKFFCVSQAHVNLHVIATLLIKPLSLITLTFSLILRPLFPKVRSILKSLFTLEVRIISILKFIACRPQGPFSPYLYDEEAEEWVWKLVCRRNETIKCHPNVKRELRWEQYTPLAWSRGQHQLIKATKHHFHIF